MPGKRTYGDACGIARALDTVGERWALMVVRELMLGPKRFTDLRQALPHVSSDILAQRLRDLEAGDVVARRILPPPAASKVYVLTPKGQALEHVLIELGRWGGANAAPPDPTMCMSFDAHILSMTSLFDPDLAGDFHARVNLSLGDHRFRSEIAEGEFEIEVGEHASPDATITADPTTLLDVLHGRRELAEALAAGELEVSGSKATIKRWVRLFPIPAPAAVAS